MHFLLGSIPFRVRGDATLGGELTVKPGEGEMRQHEQQGLKTET